MAEMLIPSRGWTFLPRDQRPKSQILLSWWVSIWNYNINISWHGPATLAIFQAWAENLYILPSKQQTARYMRHLGKPLHIKVLEVVWYGLINRLGEDEDTEAGQGEVVHCFSGPWWKLDVALLYNVLQTVQVSSHICYGPYMTKR